MQDNLEGTQSKTATEKSNTSQNKEEKSDGKMGITSETTEKKSEENKSADRRKPEKKREKRNGEGDKIHKCRTTQGRRAEASGRHNSLEAH